MTPIIPAEPCFVDGALYSAQFGDVYHAVEGAVAESRHVFIAGNDLPQRWRGTERFSIVETGFGCGVNFLATWDALVRSETACRLDFVSVEKHPFRRTDLAEVLRAWPELAHYATQLLAAYPPLLAGFHRLHFDGGRVTLTLLFGDATDMLSELDARADAFFLDGFAPGKNAAMWSDALCRQLARLAAPAASVATYTVAGLVRRGLESAGFEVYKAGGYGRKREMLKARWAVAGEHAQPARRVVVIGAGIAGASCALALARRGTQVELLDQAARPGNATSSNPAPLVRPFVTLDYGVRSRFSWTAFLYALRHYHALGAAGRLRWHGSGVLQLTRDREHLDKLRRAIALHGFAPELVREVQPADAAGLSGAQLQEGGLWFPQAGYLDGRQACAGTIAAQAARITFRADTRVASLRQDETAVHVLDADQRVVATGDAVVMANGSDAASLLPAIGPHLAVTRGQMTALPLVAPALRTPVCRDGYLTPAIDGLHYVGGTYDHENLATAVTEADHRANRARADRILPQEFAGQPRQPAAGWAGLRCASRDRLPLIGRWQARVFTCLAMGSRGFSWSPLAGEAIASELTGAPHPLERSVGVGLSPSRLKPVDGAGRSGQQRLTSGRAGTG